jgi:hypothetical protein
MRLTPCSTVERLEEEGHRQQGEVSLIAPAKRLKYHRSCDRLSYPVWEHQTQH